METLFDLKTPKDTEKNWKPLGNPKAAEKSYFLECSVGSVFM